MSSEESDWRAAGLERLEGEVADLLVIGGGIVGSRVAYEASRLGLHVALIDRGDFGGATSAASSKLVHGGLRYLATGDLALVRELQRERAILASHVAPHLVRALPLVLAVERKHRRRVAKLGAALALYGAVSGFRGPRPRLVAPSAAAGLVPLDPRAVFACGLVEEASTHDARLALATTRAARQAGAIVLSYVGATAIEQARSLSAVTAVDRLSGRHLVAQARAVVNATGPWVDRVRLLEDSRATPLVRLSKGVHAVLPLREGWHAGLALFDDARSAFAVPWHGLLLVGATDTPFSGDPADMAPTAADVDGLLEWLRGVVPSLRREPVLSAFAGLRVLAPGASETARASRRHTVEIGPRGLVSIAGGKLTNHRAIALDALRALPASVRPSGRLRPSVNPLPGAAGDEDGSVLRNRLDESTAAHVLRLYGSEATLLLEYAESVPEAFERIHPDGPDIWAQAHFAVERELAVTADDIAARRTMLGVRGLASTEVLAELGRICNMRSAHVSHFWSAAPTRPRSRGLGLRRSA